MKTLIYDIENAPHLMYAWQSWEACCLKMEQRGYMLSFAYKWLGEKKVHVCALPDYELYDDDPTDDYALCHELHGLFDEADVVIAHNGDKFDQKISKGRFVDHGFLPPSPFKSIDTLKIARKEFKLPSNRLDDLGDQLGVGRKVSHEGLSLWFKVMDGDEAAWDRMRKYNKQDVVLLEKVYLKLRPWAFGHPNMNDNMAGLKCSKCGSKHLQSRGTYRTTACSYQRYQCQGCGSWMKSRKSDKHNKPEVMAAV